MASEPTAIDKVLQAIGFTSRAEGYGLGTTGIKLTEQGAVAVNGRGRTVARR